MFGYTRDDLAADTLICWDLTPSEYRAESERQLEGFAATGRIGPYEKEYLRKDGSRSWLAFAGAALGDGTLVEYCIDVSDRRRAEEALRESGGEVRWLRDQGDVFGGPRDRHLAGACLDVTDRLDLARRQFFIGAGPRIRNNDLLRIAANGNLAASTPGTERSIRPIAAARARNRPVPFEHGDADGLGNDLGVR